MRKLLPFLFLALVAGCSSGSTEPTATKTFDGCTSEDFSYSVGVTEGAAGTSYTTLIFTNTSQQECTLEGVPSAQPVTGDSHKAVGPASSANDVTGRGEAVLLKPGDTASVQYAVATASNYSADECVVASSDGVMIGFDTPKAQISNFFPMAGYEVCTKITSTFVSGVVPGADG